MTHTPVQPQVQPVFVKAPSNGLATAALVLGVVGTVLSFIPLIGGFGAFIGGVGIALAIAGFFVARNRGVGKGKSIAGFVLGVASIIIFFVVTAATVAAVDSAVKDIDKSIKNSEKGGFSEGTEQAKAVEEGAALTHDGYEVAAGWSVANDKVLDTVGIEGMMVTNADHGSVDTPMFTVQFVGKGETILATVTCTGTELQPGQSTERKSTVVASTPSRTVTRRSASAICSDRGESPRRPRRRLPDQAPLTNPLIQRPSPSPAAAWIKQQDPWERDNRAPPDTAVPHSSRPLQQRKAAVNRPWRRMAPGVGGQPDAPG